MGAVDDKGAPLQPTSTSSCTLMEALITNIIFYLNIVFTNKLHPPTFIVPDGTNTISVTANNTLIAFSQHPVYNLIGN